MDHIRHRLLRTAAAAAVGLSLTGAALVPPAIVPPAIVPPAVSNPSDTASSVLETVRDAVPGASVDVPPVAQPVEVPPADPAPAPAPAEAPASAEVPAPAPAPAEVPAPAQPPAPAPAAVQAPAPAGTPAQPPAEAPLKEAPLKAEASLTTPSAEASVAVNDGPDDIIVKARPGRSAGLATAAAAMELRTTRTFRLTGAKVLRVPDNRSEASVLAQLRANPNVQYAEPNMTFRASAVVPSDQYYPYLYGLNNSGQTVGNSVGITDTDIDAPEAWSATQGSSAVTVGVIDSGVDWTHPDLRNRIWSNPGEVSGNGIDDDGNGYVDDIRGWDFFANDNNPMDENGHGTHVAGTIAASADSTGVVGVAPGVRIMPLRFLGKDGSGSTVGAIGAIDYAAAKGVPVLNNSWGGSGYSQALFDAISASRTAFITAAGNDGRHMDAAGAAPDYPGGYNLPNILNVAAVDNRGALAGFSNYGATSVDVAAPGVNILSTIPALNGNPQGWSFFSGTSMAAPHVAGIAALVKSATGALTGTQVVDRIRTTAVSLAGVQGKVATGAMANAAAAVPTPAPAEVAAAGTALSIRSSRSLMAYGNIATISGALASAGAGVPGQPVTLYHRRPGGSWARLATVTTSSTGTYSFAHRTPYNSFYTARFFGMPNHLASASTAVGVRVMRLVSVSQSATSVTLGTTVAFGGRVAPASAGKPIYLQRYTPSGWVNVASGTVSSTNAYRFTVKASARGTFYYRAYQPGDVLYAPALSPQRSLAVR